MKQLILMLFLFTTLQCNEVGSWLKNWQKKQIERRYGTHSSSKDQLKDWEKSAQKYEKEMNREIKAGANAGKLYRKLGESYGKLKQFHLCEIHLKKAIDLGYTQPEVFFSLALCQGNLAREQGWDYEKTIQAEKTFLIVLQLNPNLDKAKYSLSLIYFYGLSLDCLQLRF